MSWHFEQLYKRKDDRGMMANLRCILVDNKKHRAWPVLHRLGIPIENDVLSFVVGLYATHPEKTDTENFGQTCKHIQAKKDEKHGDDGKLTPTERRFQHLLAAADGAELKNRLLRLVVMAKAHGVKVNYEQLATDMNRWNDHTKNNWASAFWANNSSLTKEEGV